jgi:ankyrin repeat protein
MVDLLLRAGADVTAADDHRVTPLQRAAENVSTAMVEKLLAAGASANAVQTSGLAPLMTAARTGNVQVVNALLAHGADVNAATTETKSTALMWAVAGPHPDIVRALLDAGADPHASTLKGLPPLLFAARNGDIQMAETLIAAGVDVNATGVDGTHALAYAIVSGHDAFALFLLEQVADPKRFDGWSGRTARCRWSRLHLVGRLEPKARRERPVLQVRQDRCRPGPQAPVGAVAPRARRGPECAHHDVRHDHELYRSAQERRVRAVRVRHGRSARATPLWVAAFEMNGAGGQVFGVGSSGTSSSAEILRTLLAAGADQHLTTDDGNTPFMAAAGLGRST